MRTFKTESNRSTMKSPVCAWLTRGALAGTLVAMSAMIPMVGLAPLASAKIAATLDDTPQPAKTSTTTIVENDGTRTIRLEIVNGKVKTASVNGAVVPDNRIVCEGDTIRINDESGKEIYVYNAPDASSLTTRHGMSFSPSSPFGSTWAAGGLGSSGTTESPVIKVENPKGMIGVQLIEPDSTLRGHFGLKEGEACLVAAVFEGLPAAAAGLEPYDIIVAVDGQTPAGTEEVRAVLRAKEPGTPVELTVLKKGERRNYPVAPEAYDRTKLDSAKRRAIAAAEHDEFNALAQTFGARARGAAAGISSTARFPSRTTWTMPQEDMVVGIGLGPDGENGHQIILRLRDEQQQLNERIRDISAKMQRDIVERLEGLRSSASSSKDLQAQILELEAQLERLRSRQRDLDSIQPGQAPAAPPAPLPPDAPLEKPTRRESFNPRSSWRVSMS